jgi:TetR/AcrR family transcriptional repressor of nem operon
MGHSQVEKAQSRDRILKAAARQIRKDGLASVSIPRLMRSARLTHGAFYAHFPSRAALLAAALDAALRDGEAASVAAAGAKGKSSLKSLANSYLSPAHRDAAGEGCAVSALANEVGRADPALREVMRAHVARFIAETAEVAGGGVRARSVAISSWCTMVGAMALSRVFEGDALSDDILREARAAILERAG